jgi:hypothetical protein
MDALNIQVEMLCTCSTDGQLRPLRFRFEDAAHRLRTVSVTEVLCDKEICYVGIEAFQFVCKGLVEGAEKMFELRYTVRSHKWILFREIY